jgi:hypothetical protein
MTPRQDAGTLVLAARSSPLLPAAETTTVPAARTPSSAAWKAVLHRALTLPRLRFATSAPAADAACSAAMTSASSAPQAPVLSG